MTVIDYDNLLIEQLWTLLDSDEVNTALKTGDGATERPGRKLNQNTSQGVARSIRQMAGPGEFPRIQIEPGDFDVSPFVEIPTFAEEDQSFVADGGRWPLTRTTEAQVILWTRGLTTVEQTGMEAAIVKALTAAGPKLGLSWVSRWAMRGRRERLKKTAEDAAEQARRKTTIRVAVRTEIEGANFVG